MCLVIMVAKLKGGENKAVFLTIAQTLSVSHKQYVTGNLSLSCKVYLYIYKYDRNYIQSLVYITMVNIFFVRQIQYNFRQACMVVTVTDSPPP